MITKSGTAGQRVDRLRRLVVLADRVGRRRALAPPRQQPVQRARRSDGDQRRRARRPTGDRAAAGAAARARARRSAATSRQPRKRRSQSSTNAGASAGERVGGRSSVGDHAGRRDLRRRGADLAGVDPVDQLAGRAASASNGSERTRRPRGRITRRSAAEVIAGWTRLCASAWCTRERRRCSDALVERRHQQQRLLAADADASAAGGASYQTVETSRPNCPSRIRRCASSTLPICSQAASMNFSCWSWTTRVPKPAATRKRGSRLSWCTQLSVGAIGRAVALVEHALGQRVPACRRAAA